MPPNPAAATTERDRLGRAHQIRVDIAIALSLVPAWLRRGLADRNDEKARIARGEVVERIALAIERRFRITWRGSDDDGEDALPVETTGPLFGGPGVVAARSGKAGADADAVQDPTS